MCYLPFRPMEATHILSAEWDALSFLPLMHTMSACKTILFHNNTIKFVSFGCTAEDDCDTPQSVSISYNPVVLRISSSQDEAMMDDTENIQEN